MTIRRLPETLVNRIAAGEVIERPAAAVKELVENAIDAGATRIDVTLGEAGRALIAVADDGKGMNPAELDLAVERHATSKLPDDDLLAIRTLGFRGEALPSIGAVARLAIVSRPKNAAEAWSISVEGGAKHAPVPAASPPGTRVEVRDLFYATPARLKFLKGERAEREACEDAIARLAMAHPEIAFSLTADGRAILLTYAAVLELDFDLSKGVPPSADWKLGETWQVLKPTPLQQQEAIAWLPGGAGFVYDTETGSRHGPAILNKVMCETR